MGTCSWLLEPRQFLNEICWANQHLKAVGTLERSAEDGSNGWMASIFNRMFWAELLYFFQISSGVATGA